MELSERLAMLSSTSRWDFSGLRALYINRNTMFMTWNLLHLARIIQEAEGIPAHGNQRSLGDAGSRFDYPNPEHR